MTPTTLKNTLKRAIIYWNEGLQGNHSNLSVLNYIASEVSKQEIDYSKLDEKERKIVEYLEFLADIRTTLQRANEYWQESFNGNHSNSGSLRYIANMCKEAEMNIDRKSLEATERLMLNNLLILANC